MNQNSVLCDGKADCFLSEDESYAQCKYCKYGVQPRESRYYEEGLAVCFSNSSQCPRNYLHTKHLPPLEPEHMSSFSKIYHRPLKDLNPWIVELDGCG